MWITMKPKSIIIILIITLLLLEVSTRFYVYQRTGAIEYLTSFLVKPQGRIPIPPYKSYKGYHKYISGEHFYEIPDKTIVYAISSLGFRAPELLADKTKVFCLGG